MSGRAIGPGSLKAAGFVAMLGIVFAAAGLAAQTPSRIPGTPEEAIFSLYQRVAALEEQVRILQQRAGRGTASRVTAPFEVVDRAGQPILRVSDEAVAASGGGARVSIARGTANNYLLTFRSGGGQLVAFIGEAKDGNGNVSVAGPDGIVRARLHGTEAFVAYNKAQAAVARLGSVAAGSGYLILANANGDGIVEAGMLPEGKGVVRAYPLMGKTPIPVPNFIMGGTAGQ